MATSFTQVALVRIAHCSAIELLPGSSAVAVASGYLTAFEKGDHETLAESLALDPTSRRFCDFAGLVEVGVAAGYVDLLDLPWRDTFSEALKLLIESAGHVVEQVDLTLVNGLISRLEHQSPARVEILDSGTFHGFGAYLNLVDRMRRDNAFLAFADPAANWCLDDDLDFLRSPQHFAEAITSTRVGGMEAPQALGGVRAVEYVEDLIDFESRAENSPGVYEKALRHVRWLHAVTLMETRLKFWVAQAAGWPSADLQVAPNLDSIAKLRSSLNTMGLVNTQEFAPSSRRAFRPRRSRMLARQDHETDPSNWDSLARNRICLTELLERVSFAASDSDTAVVRNRYGLPIVTVERPPASLFESQLGTVLESSSLREARAPEIVSLAASRLPYWDALLGLDERRSPRTIELLNVCVDFANVIVTRIQRQFSRHGPVEYSAEVVPMIHPTTPLAFPSAIATESYLVASLIPGLLGSHATEAQEGATRAVAKRISKSFEVAGLHFPADSSAGRVLGSSLAEFVLALCQEDGAAVSPRVFDTRLLYGEGARIDPKVDNELDTPLARFQVGASVALQSDVPVVTRWLLFSARAEWHAAEWIDAGAAAPATVVASGPLDETLSHETDFTRAGGVPLEVDGAWSAGLSTPYGWPLGR